MSRGARYLLIVVAAACGLEALFRLGDRVFFESQHLALFKPALLRMHDDVRVVFMGSSRLERGVLPKVFDEAAKTRSFNVAIPDTSLDLFAYVCAEAAKRDGLRQAVIEVSGPTTASRPLEWEAKDDLSTAEGSLAAFVRRHSAVFRMRTALRMDSVLRLLVAMLFADRLDGSEHYGVDFVHAVLGTRTAPPVEPGVEWPVHVVPPMPGPLESYAEGYAAYTACARALQARQVRVTFVTMPFVKRYDGLEREPGFYTMMQALAAVAPVWHFDGAEIDEKYFFDTHHLNDAGAAQLAHELGTRLAFQ